MAKFSKSISFKNAEIDYDKDMIIETTKDETKTYKLSSIIEDWNGLSGINITFKKDDELESEDIDSYDKHDGEDE